SSPSGWRPARQFRRSSADDDAQPDQIGHLLLGRACRAGQGHPEDRRYPWTDEQPPPPRLDARRRRRRDRRAAALRRLHERISGYHVGLRARAGARRARSFWTAGRLRRVAAAPGLHRLRRTHRADDAGARFLPAYLRASEPCADRRALYAGSHGRLVPECRGPAQMTARDPSLADPFDHLNGSIVAEQRPWSRIEVQADIWTEAADRLSRRALTLLGLWGEPRTVHMAVADANDLSRILVLSISCP